MPSTCQSPICRKRSRHLASYNGGRWFYLYRCDHFGYPVLPLVSHPLLPSALQSDVHWDQEVCIKVGAALLALLVENSHLSEGIFTPKTWRPRGSPASKEPPQLPAFEYVYVKQGVKQQSFVRASQALIGVLLADRTLAAQLLTKVPPMLVPPLPWSRYNSGGYLTSR